MHWNPLLRSQPKAIRRSDIEYRAEPRLFPFGKCAAHGRAFFEWPQAGRLMSHGKLAGRSFGQGVVIG